jgi:hypothetical protein
VVGLFAHVLGKLAVYLQGDVIDKKQSLRHIVKDPSLGHYLTLGGKCFSMVERTMCFKEKQIQEYF